MSDTIRARYEAMRLRIIRDVFSKWPHSIDQEAEAAIAEDVAALVLSERDDAAREVWKEASNIARGYYSGGGASAAIGARALAISKEPKP